jgi:hypothetical protein
MKTALPGVAAIDVFAAESHRRIGQPAMQNWQRINEAVASFAALLGKRLQYNRITFAIRSETRMGGCLHQFRRYKDFACVVDLDNHRKLLINDIQFRESRRAMGSHHAHTPDPAG